MSIDADELYDIISGHDSIENKAAAVSGLKAAVKRTYIDLDNIRRYFEALCLAINSTDHGLHSVAFSCVCHLIKRVITQNPAALEDPADIALPLVIDKFGDQKSSVRVTAKRVFEDYWISCPNKSESAMRDIGLLHPNELVRQECLQILISRVQIQEAKFTFRPFTSLVTALLNDSNDNVRTLSQELLIKFFSMAHVKAKQDLYRELGRQKISKSVATRILKDIDLDIMYPPPSMNISLAPQHGESIESRGESLLAVSFVTDQDGYKMETLKPEYISSDYEFRDLIESMLPVFEGKESEFNWSSREKAVIRLRSIMRGNGPQDFRESMIWMLKYFSDGIIKAICSLRTTLSMNGCQLIKEVAITLGQDMDSVIEPYLTNLVRLTAAVKKLTSQTSAMVINAMIINTSYSLRYLNHINVVMSDKVAQPKIYCATWMRLTMAMHYKYKSAIEHSGGKDIIEKILAKGLVDANPGVREAMRLVFWSFYEIWPREGQIALEKYDASTRKALERVQPGGTGSVIRPNQVSFTGGNSRSGIREFISKSRETSKAESVSQTHPPKTTSLSVRAGRLGMPQRQPPTRKVPSSSISNPSSSVSLSTVSTVSSVSSISSASEVERAVVAELLEVLPRDSLDSLSAVPIVKPSLLALITSSNRGDLYNGINILAMLIKKEDLEHKNVACANPVMMPRPDIISRVLHNILSERNADGKYIYEDIIKLVVAKDVVTQILQFVSASLLIPAAVQCLTGQELLASLASIERVVDKREAALMALELIASNYSEELYHFLEQILDSVIEDPGIVEKLQEVISSSGENLTELVEKYPLLKKSEPEKVLQLSEYVEEVEIGEVEEQEQEEEEESGVLEKPQKIEGIQSAGDNETNVDEPVPSTPKRDSVVQINELLPMEKEECRVKTNDGDDDDLENRDVEVLDVKPHNDKNESMDVSAASDSDDLDGDYEDAVEIQEVHKEDNIKGKRLSPSIEELNDEIDAKLSIFEDGDSWTKAPALQMPSRNLSGSSSDGSVPSTPSSSWYSFESKKQICYSPLPENSDEASQLFAILLQQLEDGKIDAHGFRKLISIVRAQNDGKCLNTVAVKTWKEEKRQAQLRSSLLRYLGNVDLGESQMNQGLLLLKQLWMVDFEPFRGSEIQIYNSLIQIANMTTQKTVLCGGLDETQDELVKVCIQNTRSWVDLFDGVLYGFDKTTSSREAKMLTITTILKLLGTDCHKSEIIDRLPIVAQMIHKFLSDGESSVRKETYPLLVRLREKLNEPEQKNKFDQVIVSQLSSGQQHLMEYYYNKR